MQSQGILVLNKPVGERSTRCVDFVRKTLRTQGGDVKVGHGGTLDSSASGVLVLLIGRATRLSSIVMQMPKSYKVTVQLGSETSTCDYTGDVISSAEWNGIEAPDVREALYSFLGWQMQVPPDISAVHVDGKRAHRISRAGGSPKIDAKPIFVKRIEMKSEISEAGTFELGIVCGKGTYVRSIVRDLGRMLGCGAFVVSLARESVGPFHMGRSLDMAAILPPDAGRQCGQELLDAILPPEEISKFLPRYSLKEDEGQKMTFGLSVPLSSAQRITFGSFCPSDTVCAVSGAAVTVAGIDIVDGIHMIVPQVNIVRSGDCR